MVGIRYDKDGEEREFKVSTRDDVNLMLGNFKSVLSVFRTHHPKEEDVFQYWIKTESYVILGGKVYSNVSGIEMSLYDGNHELRPYNSGYYPRRGEKLVFDSRRTAICGGYNGDINGFLGHLCLLGIYSKDKEIGKKDFDVYAYIFDPSNSSTVSSRNICIWISDREVAQSELYLGRQITMLWSKKVASIRDGEIVSNETPMQNTYYVVIEDKKGNVLDVKTTTEFGVTVGSLIGSYSSKFKEEILNQRVIDDMLIKMR